MTYDGLNHYLYDAEGRLCAVKNYAGSMTGYIYNGSGIRVARGTLNSFSCNFSSNGFQTTTSWVLGPGGEQVTEYSVASGTSTWVHTNAYASGALLATYAPASSGTGTDTYFALEDWLGTKRAEVSAGGCYSWFTSMPYGNGLTPGGNCPDATEHHFTGKERDTESGNDYFGARYYASTMGRFLSPDWSAKMEPVPYAKLDNPQSLNLYSYVGNNPLSRNDPTGHYACANSKGTTISCGQDVKDMYANVHKAMNALPEGSKERAALGKVLDFMGEADKANGVTVKVGAVKGAEASTVTKDGQTTITFDMKKMNADFSKSSSPDAEKAATAAHEGEHGIQQKAEGMPQSLIGDFRGEFNAFHVQSYVNQGLGVNSVYGIWDKTLGWDASQAASYAYDEAVDYCSQGGCK